MSDLERCREAYREMIRAMIAKDAPGLKAVLDEDFVLVHMTGMRQDRDAFIRAVLDGTLNYYSAEHESIDVQTHGDVAALTGRSRVSAAVFGGGRHTWRLEQRIRLVRRDGAWRVARSEAGTY